MFQCLNTFNCVVVTPGKDFLHKVKASVYSTEWINLIVIAFFFVYAITKSVFSCTIIMLT